MKSHGRIWILAGTAVLIALAAYEFRRTQTSAREFARNEVVHIEQRAQVAAMFALLENDSRVRRARTQRAVEWVALLAQDADDASPEAYYALGLRRFYGDKDADGAEAALGKAIALRPEWSWPHNALGIVLFSQGDEAPAMESFQRAMDIDPQWARPHSDLAILYRRAGRMDDAVREALVALEMEPASPVAHYNYGVILDVLGRADEARKEYETVIGLDRTLPAPYYNIACGHAREERIAEAVKRLAQAVALDEAFREEAEKDPDFDRIRSAPEFARILEGRPINE